MTSETIKSNRDNIYIAADSSSRNLKIGNAPSNMDFQLASNAEHLQSYYSRSAFARNSELARDSLMTAFISNINGTSYITPVCRQIINEEASNLAKRGDELVEADIERQRKYANEHIGIIMTTIIAISFIGNVAYGTVAIIFPN
jgi:hypothetical protein